MTAISRSHVLCGLIEALMPEGEDFPAWACRDDCLQLQTWCGVGEGQKLEFKRELPPQVRDIAKTAAAFASSDGGVILVGVNDDGTILGLPQGMDAKWRDQFSQRVIGACREVKPPIHANVRWAIDYDKVVALIAVEKGVEAIYYAAQRPYVRRNNASRPAEPGEVEEVFRQRYSTGLDKKHLPSTRDISTRLKAVLRLMNQHTHDDVTVADLAKAMDLAAPADLDAVFEGHVPASFSFVDRFCARFSINKEWLLSGRSAPFSSSLPTESLPENYLAQIDDARPEIVYLVRSTTPVGETCIVVERDAMHTWLLPDVWHVSDHVGGSGSRDLLSLYHLFKVWSSNRSRNYSVIGRIIAPVEMQSLINGETFPGLLRYKPLSHWWQDLTDLEQEWTTRSKNTKLYGKGFVAAQDIIRKLLTSE